MTTHKSIPSICIYCNKEFLAYKSQIKKGTGKYCSKSCAGQARELPPEQKLWKNTTIPEDRSKCWIYNRMTGEGYGDMSNRKVYRRAHRFSWELHYGPIPEGMYVCHKCDVRNCVNPDHLFLGTHQDNQIDKIKKGRSKHPRGSESGGAKLTEIQVLSIKKAIKEGIRLIKLARLYNVSDHCIGSIKMGRTWAHIKEE